MRLLICTQAVDKNDLVLGFFHRWLEEFAKRYDHIIVICLRVGKYDLPANVEVLSLGKEKGISRVVRAGRMLRLSFAKRSNYDAVFVHMNQEYVLLVGWVWKLLGKHTYLWRNHPSGSLLTDSAAIFCRKIFCTSSSSYTAKYAKTILMPVGVDTELFKGDPSIEKIRHSILSLGRITPIKRQHILLRALTRLLQEGTFFSVSIYGNPLPKDKEYYRSLVAYSEQNALSQQVAFHMGIKNELAVAIYNAHEIFVNLSPAGMFDKTIFEAMACEMLVAVSNPHLRGSINPLFLFTENSTDSLAQTLDSLLKLSPEEARAEGRKLRTFVLEQHSLVQLMNKLSRELV